MKGYFKILFVIKSPQKQYFYNHTVGLYKIRYYQIAQMLTQNSQHSGTNAQLDSYLRLNDKTVQSRK